MRSKVVATPTREGVIQRKPAFLSGPWVKEVQKYTASSSLAAKVILFEGEKQN